MDVAANSEAPQWLDTATAFANHKGVPKSGLKKRQRKLLDKVPDLEYFLEEGEEVKLITSGVSPVSLLEQLTTGWIVFYINRALLVFTDRRVLHIPTTHRFDYRHSVAEVRYADCRDIRMRRHTLVVRYNSGQKERFLHLAARERKRVKAWLEQLALDGREAQNQTRSPGRRHLCPRCTEPLHTGIFECRGCRLAFKDMGTAVRLSLALPGGGYFYTRHPVLGLGDLIVEGYLIAVIIIMASDALKGESHASWVLAGFVGMFLVLEKLITIYHARRFIQEYIPQARRVQPLAAVS